MTLGVIVVFALLNFGIYMFVNPGLALILTVVGAIGGLNRAGGHVRQEYGSAAVTSSTPP